MFASHGIWWLRTRGIRCRAKEAEVNYDDFPEAQAWQEKGTNISLNWLICHGREWVAVWV